MFENYLPCGGCENFKQGCEFRQDYFGRLDGFIRAVPNDHDTGVAFVSANAGKKPLGQVVECSFKPLAQEAQLPDQQQLVAQSAGELIVAAA